MKWFIKQHHRSQKRARVKTFWRQHWRKLTV